MKNLELNQMEEVNGMSACTWGMWAVGAFWGVAITVGTGGTAGGVVAGLIVSGGYQAIAEAVCD